MTEHLPECWLSEGKFDALCICDRLRACEQRVAAMRKDSGELWLDGYGTGFQDGHSYALDAAREAVAGLRTYGDHGEVIPPDEEAAVIYVTDALAAIDALKERP